MDLDVEVAGRFSEAAAALPDPIHLDMALELDRCRVERFDHPRDGDLGAGPYRGDLGPDAVRALEAVERADVLVVGSPAYRATYTGLFKLFFDHVGQYALVDKPIVLTATGGSDRHALLVEHQMRPLFGFFQSLTLPLGIFANEGDFADYRVDSPELEGRIQQSLSRTMPLLSAHLRLDPRFAAAASQPFARPDWA